MNFNEFVDKSIDIHGYKYDYSLVEYKNIRTDVIIICPEHGRFLQKPLLHLRGSGCKECGLLKLKSIKTSLNDFINKAINIHGNKYDYSLVEYNGFNNKVKIICPTHGMFEQYVCNHLKGSGCVKCAVESTKLTKEEFIKRSIIIHNHKYDYSKVDYIKCNKKVKIICPIHGVFEQIPSSHMNGHGCNFCNIENLKSFNRILSIDNFINEARLIHGDKYDYSLVNNLYNGKINIICEKHGVFSQYYYNHLNGYGCKKCAYDLISEKNSDNYLSFMLKAKNVHNDRYDYSKVDYINSHTLVKIVCKEHGDFLQYPHNHLKGCGCLKCSQNVSRPHNFIIDIINIIMVKL